MSDPQAKISVIIPAFNCRAFIVEAVQSVLDQNYPNLEILVVDDGSTDGTGEAAAALPGVQVFRQSNGGPAAARNLGIQKARGGIYAFLDGDDIWAPGHLEALLSWLEDFDLVYGHMRWVGPEVWKEDRSPDFLAPPISDFGFGSSLIRAEAFAKVGPINDEYRRGEDTEWYMRAREKHLRIRLSGETVLYYRRHENNVTQDASPVAHLTLKILKESLDRRRARPDFTSLGAVATRPKISVVIPVFNGEKYLRQAIQSCLEQSRPPDEILVIDDGSEDRSLEIAAAMGSKVRCEKRAHAGAASARNRGVELARGEYLAFLDADDWWNPEKLALQAAQLDEHPDCAMVFGTVSAYFSEDLPDQRRNAMAKLPPAMLGRVPGTMLIRREAFSRVGPFATNWQSGEFLDWYTRSQSLGLCEMACDGAVLHRRIHGANHMLRHSGSQQDYLKILKSALDQRRKSGR